MWVRSLAVQTRLTEILEVEHPVIGPIKIVGTPVGMSKARIEPRGPAPELGQHTEEILLELGYDWEQISAINDRTRAAMRAKFIALGMEPPY